ncbi:hypothetical protein TSUD_338310 [Trifolium subterraneum]|uniref:Condensin complex subunit 1 C-terminal domain-containing protein n=1 Tax=Trifolium subterraneum TaxID=3900 RepID=A0A2Z6LT51_TRISU|nr:hypothetical protein TSUD_338310 [Trifolium subterraneum]
MASSISIPAPEAIHVLLSLLADDSSSVRESSMSSLKDLAALNPVLVLECCATVSRGGRRRFGNMAGVFQVMAFGVRALDERDVDSAFMAKLAKIATSEMISSKWIGFFSVDDAVEEELNSDWQRAATSLLVAIGSHLPDLVMEEIFLHLSGTSSALQAMVQILAEFASSSPFKCWCQAAWQYSTDFPSHLPQDGDVMSFLNSAFELLLRVWAASRDLKVRVASVEALGQMVGLITRTQLKAALPRLVPTILDLYKKDLDIAFLATCSLHNLLNASLLSESGPPMLDFEDLTLTLATLLPVVSMNSENKDQTVFSVGLKMYNEVQHCFLTVGLVYPDDLFLFLVTKCRLKEEAATFGALCVLKHLLPRLSEAWHSKIPLLVEAVKSLLEEHNLGVRKALSELIVVMASHCYLVGSSGELFIEYLIRNCALTEQNQSYLDSIPNKRIEMKNGAVTPGELRAVCEKGLLLVTITIPEMEHILWPFLLKMIIPQAYTGAVAMVCRCISELWRHRSYGSDMLSECKSHPDIPTAEVGTSCPFCGAFTRSSSKGAIGHPDFDSELMPSLNTAHFAFELFFDVLCLLAPLFPKNINLFWQDEIPKMKAYVSDTDDLKQDPSHQDTWDDMIINFLAESLDVIQDADWIMSLGNVFAKHYELYTSDDEHAAILHRIAEIGSELMAVAATVAGKRIWGGWKEEHDRKKRLEAGKQMKHGFLEENFSNGQWVNDRAYVHDKMNWMYKQSNIAAPTNRLGLAKAMGLVAASHLDTVLEKLKDIIDNVGQTIIQRLLSLFSDSYRTVESDDIHAALALMYGYAAKYAPSSVIEARINALVSAKIGQLSVLPVWRMYSSAVGRNDLISVGFTRKLTDDGGDGGSDHEYSGKGLDRKLTNGGGAGGAKCSESMEMVQEPAFDTGTNMLSRLLHVRHPIAKQAVITAIDLLGNAVINAAESGAPFPLKRRDQLLDYILTLMGRDDNDGFADYNELLRTQALAISACTTLVSVEPKLTVETRNYVMKATLGFFAIQNDPVEVVNPLIDNLISLLCAILLTGGEDGRSRAELLMLILRQIDQFISSPVEYQRKRGCLAVHEMLLKFRMVCVSGYCALGCHGSCAHTKQIDPAFVLPSREALCLGDRVTMYLPRCADTNSEVRKISAQILDQLFSISLSLPKPPGLSISAEDIEFSYSALSSLEDVIAMLRNDTSIDPSEVFNRIISSLCILLTKDELVAMLHDCSVAICDKIKQSAEGAIQAVVEFVTRRGGELTEIDISRTTQSLISATVHATDKHLRVETLGAIASLAETTSAKTVFDEVLATAGKDIVTKDISRLRGGWPMQDAFYAFSQHMVLSGLFLEHVISVLSQIPVLKCDVNRVEDSQVHNHTEDGKLEAAIFALTAFFRGGGKVGKRAVEQNYASVLSELMLQLGSCHGLAYSGHLEPLRNLLTAFQAFCECVGDLEMGKILARDGELSEKERWINLIGDIAGCISIKRPKEIQNICQVLIRSLDRPQKYQREAAAAALSEFVRYRLELVQQSNVLFSDCLSHRLDCLTEAFVGLIHDG